MLNREPSDVTLYELLANIAQERPDLLSKTPREWVEMAVANNPQDAQVYILRAKFLTNSGQHEEAKLSLQQAVGCDVSDIKIRLSLAAAWLRLDMTERAEEQLVIVDAEDTTLPELWQLRAVAAAKIGDPVKSAQVARDGLDRLGDGKAGFFALCGGTVFTGRRYRKRTLSSQRFT
jgi:predicted Zn-dependent protease